MTTGDAEQTAFFFRDGDALVPTRLAQGPWGETASGHVIGGILGWAIERDSGDPELQPSRLTVDMLRPTAMQPVQVQTKVVRDGRRIRLVDAELTQNGTLVARASGLLLRRGEQPAQDVWSSPIAMPPIPEDPEGLPDAPMLLWAYNSDGVTGTPQIGIDDWWQASRQKFGWVRENRPLVDGEPLTPFVRAALAADVTSSLTHSGTAGLKFINADFTLTLSRLPDGPYVGLAALTHSSDAGVATGTAAIFDERGPIGSAIATALANPGFRPPFGRPEDRPR